MKISADYKNTDLTTMNSILSGTFNEVSCDDLVKNEKSKVHRIELTLKTSTDWYF